MKKITDLPMYVQIYLAVIGAVLAVVLCTIVIWLGIDNNNRHLRAFATFSAMVEDTLPPATAGRERQSQAIDTWIAQTHTRFALFTANGALLSRALSPPLPFPAQITPGGYFDDWRGTRFVWQMKDRRILVVQFSTNRAARPWLFIFMLLALAFAVACAALPVIRRLTARLELLQQSVESLGKGRLSSRVEVSGQDEVGQLAASFNRAAGQIEALVRAQKTMLANASHELRSPLARIQMASALLAAEDSPLRQELLRSVAELDTLVEEILTVSRLERVDADQHATFSTTDLTALAAEECARAAVPLTADHLIAWADARLMRRLMRNVIENALKHGGKAVTVSLLADAAGHALFRVSDRGPGIPEPEMQRIFQPFYRLARETDGTGLGLALVGAIAAHHGGSVWVHNRETGGACFHVRIPLRPPA
jgi:signal transduction histidine kinase